MKPKKYHVDFIDSLNEDLARAHAVTMLISMSGAGADGFDLNHAHIAEAIGLVERLIAGARKTVDDLHAWHSGESEIMEGAQ